MGWVPPFVRRRLGLLADAIAVAGLVGAAFAIDRDLLTAGDYPRFEWGEWFGHAQRVRLLQEHGFVTWDHAWSGGLSPFQTYQFMPHLVTALVAEIGSASVGRTMLLLEGLVIFWIRCSGYVTARLFGISRAPSLIAGVLTFGVFSYSAEVLTFTTLWGLALVPLLLVAAWRYRDTRLSLLIALIVGLSVYVHPHVMLAGVIALGAVFLAGDLTRERVGRLFLQGVVVVVSMGFYWVPVLFSAIPTMQDPTSADPEFMRNIFEGSIERFNELFWVLAPIIALTIIAFWRSANVALVKYLAIFFGAVLFLIAFSYAGVGTESIRLTQTVRLLNLMPLGLAMFAAVAAQAALDAVRGSGARNLIAASCTLVVAVALFVPMFRFAEDREYEPAWYGEDVLAEWFEANNDGQPGRVWLDGKTTPWYTFKRFDMLQSARSPFVQGEWSLLARPLQEGILVGDPDWETTEDSLRAMGVGYILVADNWAAGRELRNADSQPTGYDEVLRFETFPPTSLYKTPFEPVMAFTAATGELLELDVPDTKYEQETDRALRDRLTGEYSDFAYADAATPVGVQYPSPTGMTVELDDLEPGQQLVVAENWDRSWKAKTADGEGLPVHRYGPNYIRVDVSELAGDVVIEVRHEMSWDWKVGIALTVLSFPVAFGFMYWERRRSSSSTVG